MEREKILEKLGYSLPEVVPPLANYVPGKIVDNYIYVSGQLPIIQGKLAYMGKLGEDCSMEDGVEAAKTCALNCIGVLKGLVGDLDRIEEIVKISGFINSSRDFSQQPKVLNGASDLLGSVFGEHGIHARSAVGVAALPLNACCEVELIAKIITD